MSGINLSIQFIYKIIKPDLKNKFNIKNSDEFSKNLNLKLVEFLQQKLRTDDVIIKQSSLQSKIDLSWRSMLNGGCESDQEALHLIRPMNLNRFGPTQEENQRRFWVMTHQMKKRIIEWLKEEKANLKQDIQSKAKKIIEKVDDKSEIYLNINTLLELIECSDSNHRLIQFALILLRTEVAITLKDEDANFFVTFIRLVRV